jgi:hypothetical protein
MTGGIALSPTDKLKQFAALALLGFQFLVQSSGNGGLSDHLAR